MSRALGLALLISGSWVSWMRSYATFASQRLNRSALGDGMDWMIRNSVSVFTASVAYIFPSGPGIFSCPILSDNSSKPSSSSLSFKSDQYLLGRELSVIALMTGGRPGMMLTVGDATLRPLFLAASYPAFACCICTTSDGAGNIVDDPRYYQVTICCCCGHTVCPADTVRGFCLGCWYEPPEVRGFEGPWSGGESCPPTSTLGPGGEPASVRKGTEHGLRTDLRP